MNLIIGLLYINNWLLTRYDGNVYIIKQERREAGESKKQTEVKMEKCEICNKALGNEDTTFNIGDRELVASNVPRRRHKPLKRKNAKLKSRRIRTAKRGSSASGANSFSRKANFGKKSTSATSADSASTASSRAAKESPCCTERRKARRKPGFKHKDKTK